MDVFINELKKIWKELGLGQKISIILALVAIGIGMSAVVLWSTQKSMQLLYGKLDSKDMTEVVSFLEQMNIPYKVENGGSAVFIPSDKVYSIRMQLASKGVPSGEGVGFEIFDQNNFGISDFVQRTNYTRAIQGELSRTIVQLKNVRTARVMIVMPENRLLSEANRVVPTASVFVDTAGIKLGEDAVNSIRFLVANAVQGLAVDDVAVVDNNGHVLSENLKNDKTFGVASSQIRYKQSLEDYYSKKIESMLSKITGSGNVVAKVAVDIESDLTRVTEEKFDPEGQVVRSQSTVEDVNSSKENSSSQIVGVQGAGAAGSSPRDSAGSINMSEAAKKNKTVAYEISHATTEIVKNPGTIKYMSAAVFVAKRYKEEAGKKTELPRTPEDLKSIQKMVANTLGLTEASLDQISVQEADFQSNYSYAKDSIVDTGAKFVGLLKPIMVLIGALGVFAYFLKILKRYKPENMPTESSLDNLYGLKNLSSSSAPPTPEALNNMIRQKTENISTALKNWANTTEAKP